MTAILAPAGLPACLQASHRLVLTIVLCAEWCGTCREFRGVMESLAVRYPQVVFSWIDIEDDAELVSDLEVESFPALLVVRDGAPLYYGTVLPTESAVVPLLRAVSDSERPLSHIPDDVLSMLDALRR